MPEPESPWHPPGASASAGRPRAGSRSRCRRRARRAGPGRARSRRTSRLPDAASCRARRSALEGSGQSSLPEPLWESGDAARPCDRRWSSRLGGRLAAGAGRRAGDPARDAAGAGNRCAQDGPAGRARLLELVSLRRPDGQRRGPAARGDAAAGLARDGHGRPPQAAGRRCPGGGPGRLCGGRPGGARGGAAGDDPARGGAGPAPARVGPGHRGDGPPHLACLGRGYQARGRPGAAGLLRCHRPDRLPREHRHGGGMVPVALRQGRAGRHGCRLHQLPDGRRAVRGLHRRAARGREDRVQGMGGEHALFRGLPADRGDGGARPRHACASGR